MITNSKVTHRLITQVREMLNDARGMEDRDHQDQLIEAADTILGTLDARTVTQTEVKPSKRSHQR